MTKCINKNVILLCLPKIILAIAKNGWLHRLCVNDTAGVFGSVSQCHAPTAVHTEIKPSSTENNIILNTCIRTIINFIM